MSDVVIRVDNISKQYRLGQVGTGTLTHDLKRWWHLARGKEDPFFKIGEQNIRETTGKSEYVWALKDITFEVKQGEVLGIIGENGAGKSTLLKILSRIVAPTEGGFKIKGHIASLLEVGTGFHPELSGRENIFLNGAILGMTKNDIQRKLDEIISFSGVERYIDTPVKRYSSGMYVRLAFAVAAHLEPQIMIVDEVLAVGDAEFQKKCLGKMKDVANEGRTVLFVSHNMAAIKTLCTSAILLKNGCILSEGNTDAITDKYLETIISPDENHSGQITWNGNNAPHSPEVTFTSVTMMNEEDEIRNTFYTSSPIKIDIAYELHEKLSNSRLIIQLRDSLNNIIFTSTNQASDLAVKDEGHYKTTCFIPANLLNQRNYHLYIQMGIPLKKVLINATYIMTFNTILTGNNGSTVLSEKWPGAVAPLLQWETVKIR